MLDLADPFIERHLCWVLQLSPDAECPYAECHCAESQYAERHYTECH